MDIIRRIFRKIQSKWISLRIRITSRFAHGWTITTTKWNGLVLLLNKESYIDYLIWINGQYNKKLIELADSIIKSEQIQYFIDIGANIGEVSLSLKKNNNGLKVIAFEPIFRNYIQHEMEKIINHLDYDLYNVAISNYTGELTLHAPKDIPSIHYGKYNAGMFSVLENQYLDSDQKIVVPCFRLDDFIEEKHISLDSPVLIKMDVEGAELAVLQGFGQTLSSPNKRISLIIELNFSQSTIYTQVVKLLDDYGYQMYSVNREKIIDQTDLPDDDYLFVRKP